MKKITLAYSLYSVILFFTATLNVYGASYQKAEMFYEHGLVRESKSELIEVLFSTASDTEKAKAYYLLGSIAFAENKTITALESWRQLIKKYPTSKEAILVKDRIKVLAEIAGEASKESVENAIAQSYLHNGDFWSKGKDYKFIIDSSWIPHVEAAITWYDKVIKEYPNTPASRVAYEEKMRTLLGWNDASRGGEDHGIEQSFVTYMPKLLETFNSFEKEHPNASSMQAFRYQIAQTYWKKKKWEKAKEWLNLIIEKSGESDSFYKDLAQRRLQHFEY